MESLFDSLLHLKVREGDRTPLEDFFTELFAYLLKTHTNLLSDFLKDFFIASFKDLEQVYVSTQEKFDALPHHTSSSIPDIFIELVSENQRYIIFIESKIGSVEGWEQLKKYAEHLNEFKNIKLGILVYITRDYEPKNSGNILKKCDSKKIHFLQLRWYKIFNFLKKYKNDFLVDEIIRFMEVNDMSQSRQFSAVDILALTNFPRVKSIMDETIRENVYEEFKKICGNVNKGALSQFNNYNRYLITSAQNQGMWIGLGYWIDPSIMSNYPDIGVIIEIDPKSDIRDEVLKAMSEIAHSNPGKWRTYNVNETKAWAGITQRKPLHYFMSGEDHVALVKEYFIETLVDICNLKKMYPNLPWKIS